MLNNKEVRKKDITYDYVTFCGIIHAEQVENLTPELEQLGKMQSLSKEMIVETMIQQYDGYHFHPNREGVFNPFSTLSALQEREISEIWFPGMPIFLVELLKKSEFDLRILIDGVETQASPFIEYCTERNNPIPLF